jgi:hypothetical protein
MSGDGDVPDHLIVSALEFAVGIAAAGAKLRPALPFPPEIRPFLKFTKLPPKARAEVRSAVEGDTVFLERLAMVAVPELVDEAGLLWLQRPEGWHERLASLGAAEVTDLPADLRRAERRREAAEQAARRAVAELAVARIEIERRASADQERVAELDEARRDRDRLREQGRADHAAGRRAAARLEVVATQLDERTAELERARGELAEAIRLRDVVLADRATSSAVDSHAVAKGAQALSAHLTSQAERAAQLVQELHVISERLAALEPVRVVPAPVTVPARPTRTRRSSRRPIALPGGLYGSSAEAAEFLVRRSGVLVLVDGYNVAKLAWPQLELDEQRGACIDACEDIARRYGPEITVVFDGATVFGRSGPRRVVRVAFSAEGVSADDVIRSEVLALADAVPVVVVTNDQAIVADVRGWGANVLSSEQWLALAGR